MCGFNGCILTAFNAASSPCFDVRFFLPLWLELCVVYVALNLFVICIADTHSFVDLSILKLTQESVLVIAESVCVCVLRYFRCTEETWSTRTIMAFSNCGHAVGQN